MHPQTLEDEVILSLLLRRALDVLMYYTFGQETRMSEQEPWRHRIQAIRIAREKSKYINMYTYIFIYTYKGKSEGMRVAREIQIYIYTYICIYIRMCIRIKWTVNVGEKGTWIYVCIFIHMYTYMRKYTYIHIYPFFLSFLVVTNLITWQSGCWGPNELVGDI